jgi:hypothetical protein
MLSGIFSGFVEELVRGLGHLVVGAVNALILALATAIGGLLSILPNMPALPDPPEPFTMAAGWVAWFIPVGTILQALTAVMGFWLLWQAVAIALRWAKALGN